MISARFLRFQAVGVLGIVVQLILLALFQAAGWSTVIATAAAVEGAILHNFWWHQRWTWAEPSRARSRRELLVLFLKFQTGAGLMCLIVNVLITTFLADYAGLHVILANLLAISTAGILSYFIHDRLVFVSSAANSPVHVSPSIPPRAAIRE